MDKDVRTRKTSLIKTVIANGNETDHSRNIRPTQETNENQGWAQTDRYWRDQWTWKEIHGFQTGFIDKAKGAYRKHNWKWSSQRRPR